MSAGGHVMRNRIRLRSGLNLNNLTTPGIYATDNATNAPTAADYLVEVVVSLDTSLNPDVRTVIQEATLLSDGSKFTRVYNGTSWSTWAEGGGGATTPDTVSVETFGAVADCQFIDDAVISSSDATLTSASNPWTSADVGKSIQVGGAGAAGALLSTTILTFNSAGSVELATNASTTIASGGIVQWGTDNTTAFNDAIAALTEGGTVRVGAGYFLVGSINLTHHVSVRFVGAAQGFNNFTLAEVGTVLVPNREDCAVIDCVGSVGLHLEYFQVQVHPLSPVKGQTGILLARSSTLASGNITMYGVSVTGQWTAGALYVYGVGDSKIYSSGFGNRIGNNLCAVFTRDNTYSLASLYRTIATGFQGMGNWAIYDTEFHDQKHDNGITTAGAIYLRGAAAMRFYGCLIDSSAQGSGGTLRGNLICVDVDSSGCGVLLAGCTFYTETANLPDYNIFVDTGSTLELSDFHSSNTFGTAKFNALGTLNFVGGEEIRSAVEPGSAVSLSTGTPANVTSITLTPGKWDVSALVGFNGNAATLVKYILASVSSTSATLNSAAGHRLDDLWGDPATGVPIFAVGNTPGLSFKPIRYAVSVNTTVYLVAQADFAVSTMGAFGELRAVRVSG